MSRFFISSFIKNKFQAKNISNGDWLGKLFEIALSFVRIPNLTSQSESLSFFFDMGMWYEFGKFRQCLSKMNIKQMKMEFEAEFIFGWAAQHCLSSVSDSHVLDPMEVNSWARRGFMVAAKYTFFVNRQSFLLFFSFSTRNHFKQLSTNPLGNSSS